MGGEHHKSSRSGAWEGYEKLKQALEGLATAKGVSQSRIGAVAKLAAHYSKFYKHVVHDIEVFLWKAEVEHRLAGLYAIDAIIRQAHAKNDPKDAYVKRFLIRLSDTIAAVKKVPEQSQPKVRHVIEEWQKRGIYTPKQIEDVGGREYLYTGQEERSGNVTPRTSPGKLASLLSIIKQKKEEQVHSGDPQSRPPHEGSYGGDGRQRDDAAAYNHRSYDDRRVDGPRYDRRDAGGIMGDAPGMPNGAGRVRRAPEDRGNEFDERDPKKARGSRWGPPKLDNDRPAPIITSLDREGDYRPDSGRSGYRSPPGSSRQAPFLQSPRGGPPRHKEWNRNAPSSRGSGAGWPREGVRSPQSGGLGRQSASPYEQGGMQQSPFSGSDDRRSPGSRIPGTSGELCRNFLAGRCTFGDRCWYDNLVHIHDPQAAAAGGGRPEMGDSKRKTVLCNNYPLGKCRFGDKCRYYLISSCELDKNARYPPRPPVHGDQPGGRWQPSPSSRPGMEQSRISPSAPPSQARSYGAPQVYNEPHGDRGSRGGDSSVSYANAAAPSPGGRRLPSDHQPTSTAPTQGYPGTYATASSPYGAAGGSSYTNQGPSFPSGADQGWSHIPGGAPVLPSPGTSGSQSYGGDRAVVPAPSAKVLADDDDGDAAEPEFTLEYDDED
ncbi:hypothetical protein PHYSODRAFT_310030 [Phytophthora sojae]|uniref:C3H1-type domain-containing protein n=1 Tax=Phytophthora sojae (strain P6497) TaxID=1094619 RepID=G4YN57_PHYSP|nr:hypothetical protein PHYSODRAFT_310030 [Phytophthora sojae]EGZ29852.1 hypothetical protein PHYSODRAFT_310030 [Phytophthora sojae]|eukprot:XP_009517127.1 hypothetical protein PHYSODRAFT_310030 [Phytophthora sojae]